ncbi:MAG: UDP-N-acetylmuramoyl-L-alanine--D-glutamate ligase [Actinobacteria bacterium]|nr:UDP-N-acetylmuramoyl-L-alanine--D-glutamate ligase [Actinomycetota bacterium]
MKPSLILGYGATGKDIEKYLISESKKYVIYDDNKNIPNELNFQLEDITNLEMIYVSPGIRKDHKILNIAEESNIKVTTDIEYFNDISNVKIVGVTGTNGKTTFVSLLNKILNKYGYKSNVAGNIGISPLNLINDTEDLDFLILELSSFQLCHINELRIDTSIVLNIYEDHIDWHNSFEEYAESKLKIFNFTDNDQNNFLGSVDEELNINDALLENITVVEDINNYFLPNYFDEFVTMFVAICSRFEISEVDVIEFLSSEPSAEHRFELFYSKNGVNFINDSKSTNLESVNKASLKVNNCMLIMHGLAKGINPNKLVLSNEIKAILVPQNSEFDVSMFKRIVIKYESIEDLQQLIKENYRNFNTVLFSCGGSSFSDFKNYVDRGIYFKKMIEGEI